MIELNLSDEQMGCLRKEAAACRMTPEEYVIKILKEDLASDDAGA